MSYNNCCDPCQGYYEPFQYYEPSDYVENWKFHAPKFHVPHVLESILPSGEKLVDIVMHRLEPMLLPKLKELLKDKSNGVVTMEGTNVMVHEGPLLLKLKDFIETDIIKKEFGSFGNAASALFNEHWGAISSKLTSELNPFINTHLAELTADLGLPAGATISVVENYFDLTEDYGIMDSIQEYAMKLLNVKEFVEKKIGDVVVLEKSEGYYADDRKLVIKAGLLLNEARKWLEEKGVTKYIDKVPEFMGARKKVQKYWAGLWGPKGSIAKLILPKVSQYITTYGKTIIDYLVNLVKKSQTLAQKLGFKSDTDIKSVAISAENFTLEGFVFLGGVEPYQYFEYEPYVYNNYCNC